MESSRPSTFGLAEAGLAVLIVLALVVAFSALPLRLPRGGETAALGVAVVLAAVLAVSLMRWAALHPPRWQYRWLLLAVGAALTVLGLTLFMSFAVEVVTHGTLVQIDQSVAVALHHNAEQQPRWVIEVARAGSFMGRELVIIGCVLLGAYWLFKRHWRELSMMFMGVVIGEPLFEFLSNFVGRHRPVWPDPFDPLPGPGFPSGHSMSAVMFYGLLAYLIVPHLKSRAARVAVVVVAVAIMLFIGLSRVYLGAHYLSDVLAGYSMGLAWGAFTYSAVETNDRKPA